LLRRTDSDNVRQVSSVPVDFLRGVPLFAEVSDRGLREIGETLTRRSYAAGETVVDEGEGGIAFFVVEKGTATVAKGGGETLTTLRPGDHFGEVALLAGSSRTATITADTDLVCWGMTGWTFRPMLRSEPSITLKLLEGLARQQAR
jgi:CRP-like cAMP-binding protein